MRGRTGGLTIGSVKTKVKTKTFIQKSVELQEIQDVSSVVEVVEELGKQLDSEMVEGP